MDADSIFWTTAAVISVAAIGTVLRRRTARPAPTPLAHEPVPEPNPHLAHDAMMEWLRHRLAEHSSPTSFGWCPVVGRYNCDLFRDYGNRLDTLRRQAGQATR